MRLLKQYGTSDAQIALLTGSDERFVRAYRKGLGVVPSMKTGDTCAAEFESATEYHYKTYENLMRPAPAARRGVAAERAIRAPPSSRAPRSTTTRRTRTSCARLPLRAAAWLPTRCVPVKSPRS